MNITLSNKIGSDCQESISANEFFHGTTATKSVKTDNSQEIEDFITVQKFKNIVKETMSDLKT